MSEQSKAPAMTERGLFIERIFDAKPDLVWKAWSDPKLFQRWWGPKDYSAPSATIDFRVGGKWVACMRSPEGQDIWATGVYKEIVPMERIVSTDSFADEHGNVVAAAHYGFEVDFPLEMLITVTFEDMGGRTKLTLLHEGLPAGEHHEGAGIGWNQSFDKLAASLA
jgi:uncharacterized protein YndB with AHSA1/START domain